MALHGIPTELPQRALLGRNALFVVTVRGRAFLFDPTVYRPSCSEETIVAIHFCTRRRSDIGKMDWRRACESDALAL
jgi:hypothetical protein